MKEPNQTVDPSRLQRLVHGARSEYKMKLRLVFVWVLICPFALHADSPTPSKTYVTYDLLGKLVFPRFKVRETNFIGICLVFEQESKKFDPKAKGIRVQYADEVMRNYEKDPRLRKEIDWDFKNIDAIGILEILTQTYPLKYSIEDDYILLKLNPNHTIEPRR